MISRLTDTDKAAARAIAAAAPPLSPEIHDRLAAILHGALRPEVGAERAPALVTDASAA